jgi:hypothetical protein
MPVVFVFHGGLPVIETRLVGKLAPNELTDEMKKVIELMHRQNRYALIEDCTNFRDWHSIIDTYHAIDALVQSGSLFKIKKAVILPTSLEAKSKIHSWVTICNNRGVDARAFETRQGAIDWLRVQSYVNQ